jgi:hypothetical protein
MMILEMPTAVQNDGFPAAIFSGFRYDDKGDTKKTGVSLGSWKSPGQAGEPVVGQVPGVVNLRRVGKPPWWL